MSIRVLFEFEYNDYVNVVVLWNTNIYLKEQNERKKMVWHAFMISSPETIPSCIKVNLHQFSEFLQLS